MEEAALPELGMLTLIKCNVGANEEVLEAVKGQTSDKSAIDERGYRANDRGQTKIIRSLSSPLTVSHPIETNFCFLKLSEKINNF